MWIWRLIRRYPKSALFAANFVVLAIFWPFGPRAPRRVAGECLSNLSRYAIAAVVVLLVHAGL
jgi:hypothetical protein